MSSNRERQQREQHNSNQPFLKLPAELRLAIYSYILPTDQIIDIQDPRKWHTFNVQYGSYHEGPQVLLQGYAGNARPEPNLLAIMGVCRQLRNETMHHYFSSNTFLLRVQNAANGYPRTVNWIETRSDQALHSIQKLLAVGLGVCSKTGRYTDRAWLVDLKQQSVQYVHQGKCEERANQQREDLAGLQRRFLELAGEEQSFLTRVELQELLKSVGCWEREIRHAIDSI